MLAALSLLGVQQSVGTAMAYFPIVPGNRWSYIDTDNGKSNHVEDHVLANVMLGDEDTIPIESTIEGRAPEMVYYKVTPAEISVLSFDLEHPLESPYPILKVPKPGQRLTWQVHTETMIMDQLGPITMKGTARYLPRFEMARKTLPAIEVTIHTEFSVPSKKNQRAESDQVADYVKGIGLVRFRDTGHIGKQHFARLRKLVSFTPSLDPMHP